MTRNDVHRPSVLEPADYRWVGYTDDGNSERTSLSDGPLFHGDDPVRHAKCVNQIHPGGCDSCGHRPLTHRYYYEHKATGEVIVLGFNCVEMMGFESAAARKAQKAVKAKREAEEGLRKRKDWEATEDENRVAGQFLIWVQENAGLGRVEDFLLDLHAKANKYGSLTERQRDAVLKIMKGHEEREANAANGDKDEKIPQILLEGRHQIKGKVISYKWKDDGPFSRYVMTIKDDRGFRVWGTAPSGLVPEVDIDASEDTGDPHPMVSFYATIKVSDRDKTFGFFKRPTKAAVIEIGGVKNA